MRTIIISNESTVVSDADAAAYVAAQQIQINRDFAPLYSGLTAALTFWPKAKGAPPKGVEILHILDNSDQADALGYHELNPAGYPEGFSFAETTIQDGDPWQGTTSHECLEQLLDPLACWTSQAASGGQTVWVALECCDAVEQDTYAVNGVPMSNFVLPNWWTGVSGKVDFLSKLTQGLSLDAGGYIAYADSQGEWQQTFGSASRHKGPAKFSRHGRYLLHAHHASRGIRPFAMAAAPGWLSVLEQILQAAPGIIASVQQVVSQVTTVIAPVATPGTPVLSPAS